MDYIYLAESLASLTGLPVRLYTAGKFTHLYHHTRFKPDLAITEEENIFRDPGNVSYYMDENFLYYGLFRSKGDGIALVIGPVAQMAVDHGLAVRILRSMGEGIWRAGELMEYFSAMPAYPLRNFLQILCTVNYFLNDEKLDVGRLLLGEGPLPPAAIPPKEAAAEQNIHNTYELEELMLSYVEFGRVDEIQAFFRHPPEGRAGTLAGDALRQEKNLLICAATLVTRAAIRGGLERETAFALSDLYIQKAELLEDCAALSRLNAQMVLDFAKRVKTAKCGAHNSKPVRAARDYILEHISEPVSTEALAAALGMNRTYLCSLFARETGMTVNQYVANIKLEEAKRLLRVTRKSIAEIGAYLGFSSQSYFQKVFRKHTGVTPGNYRGPSAAAPAGQPNDARS